MEVSRCMYEVIGDRLADLMTAMIPQVLSKSSQDRSEAHSITENTVDSAITSSIEGGHLDDLVSECLRRIVDKENIIHVMTSCILGNWAFIPLVARFVKCNTLNVLHGPKCPATMTEFVETGSRKSIDVSSQSHRNMNQRLPCCLRRTRLWLINSRTARRAASANGKIQDPTQAPMRFLKARQHHRYKMKKKNLQVI